MARAMQTKKVIAVKCNICHTKLNAGTEMFYAPAVRARFKIIPGNKENGIPERKELVFKKSLTHRRVDGTNCDGTLSTVEAGKIKTHKASRDRKAKGSMKG